MTKTILFAHAAYQLAKEFAARGRGEVAIEVRAAEDLRARLSEADVLVVSGLWRNDMLPGASKLRFVQSISAGTDQYDRAAFAAAKVRLASAQGANEIAVSEHAMALLLALARHIHVGRDNQRRAFWRPMITDRGLREDEIAGKTIVIVGLGRIGSRLARLAKAFDMRVVGVKRGANAEAPVDALVTPDKLVAAVSKADVVVLTCPLTSETQGLVDARVLAAMKPTSYLINVARGRVVDEAALIEALVKGGIAGAGLDCTVEEPLAPSSPLWGMTNVLITPHSAGETRAYERNVVDILVDNLDRLARGEKALVNQIV